MGKDRIRLGMVGGRQGAFIGNMHRIASWIDGDFELVVGCFSAMAAKLRCVGRSRVRRVAGQ